jgi:iron transport multicopper oxidase
VLTANQPAGNYWVRANPNKGSTGFDGGLNLAILRYRSAPIVDPTTTQPPNPVLLLETDLHPLERTKVPGLPASGGADVNLNLALTFNTTILRFAVNGVVYVAPTVPVLLQILSGAQSAQDLLPAGSVYTLPRNKVIEVTLPGGAFGSPVRAPCSNLRFAFANRFLSILSIFTEYVHV